MQKDVNDEYMIRLYYFYSRYALGELEVYTRLQMALDKDDGGI